MIKSTADVPCICNTLLARKRSLELALAESGIPAGKRKKLEVILHDLNREIHAAGCVVVPELPDHVEVGAEKKLIRHKLLVRASSHSPTGERYKRKQQKTVRGRPREHVFGFVVEPVSPPTAAQLAKAERIKGYEEDRKLRTLEKRYAEWQDGVPAYVSPNDDDLDLVLVGADDDFDPEFHELGAGG